MNPIIEQRNKEIEEIILSEDEIKTAIWNYKVWKWNDIRNREYWQELEKVKPEKDESEGMVSYKADAPSVQAVQNVVQKRVKKRWGKAHKANKAMR